MTVIDVDTHWEVERLRCGRAPAGAVAGPAPDAASSALALRDRRRPPAGAPRRRGGRTAARCSGPRRGWREERGGPVILHPQHESTAGRARRVDGRVGIDHCLVNPGGYWQLLEFLGDDRAARRAPLQRLPGRATGRPADRLHGVAVLDLTDPRSGGAELERARERGTAAFFLYTVNGRPPRGTLARASRRGTWSGRPRPSSAWSRSSTSATPRRTSAVGPTSDGTDRAALASTASPGSPTRSASTSPQNLARLAALRRRVPPAPDLTVILEEMKVGLAPAVRRRRCTRQALSSPALGDWPLETSRRRDAAPQRASHAAPRVRRRRGARRAGASCPRCACSRRTTRTWRATPIPSISTAKRSTTSTRLSASVSSAAMQERHSPGPATSSSKERPDDCVRPVEDVAGTGRAPRGNR